MATISSDFLAFLFASGCFRNALSLLFQVLYSICTDVIKRKSRKEAAARFCLSRTAAPFCRQDISIPAGFLLYFCFLSLQDYLNNMNISAAVHEYPAAG